MRKLRELCAIYWNPIGIPMQLEGGRDSVDQNLLPDDEYDNYLTGVREMLKTGAVDAEVIAYLDEVEREDMGLSRPHGDKAHFVAAVRAALSDAG